MIGCYELRVRGRLGPAVAASFEGMQCRTDGSDTVLFGAVADQSALYGLIDRIEALGLDLLEVRAARSP